MNGRFFKHMLAISLAVLLAAVPVLSAGCVREKAPPTPAPIPASGLALASTLVPNTGLDIYVYLRQENPTKVPKDLVRAATDLDVESLAVWGIASGENDFTLGGALTFVNAAEATQTFRQVSQVKEFWTLLSDRTIYFVEGAGTAAEKLQATIKNKDFKKFDDAAALKAVAALPDGGRAKLAGVVIAKPSPALLKPVAAGAGAEASGIVETLLALAQLEIIVGGIYAPQQIDAVELARLMNSGKIWTANLGVVSLIKSGLPGPLVSPLVKRYLESAGFTTVTVNDLTFYRGELNVQAGVTLPVLLRVEGNQIFASVAGQETYTQALLTGVRP